jgi:hypothetical protein
MRLKSLLGRGTEVRLETKAEEMLVKAPAENYSRVIIARNGLIDKIGSDQ